MLNQITFKVVSISSSKLGYIFKRVFIRIGHKFLLYFFIALILAVFITFIYYKYISRLLKIEERKIMGLLKRVVRAVFVGRRIRPGRHDIFKKKRIRKLEKRKKKMEMFGSKEPEKESITIKEKKKEKEEPVKEVKEEGEYVEKEGEYIMWPPKTKEEEKKEKTFDELSKLK